MRVKLNWLKELVDLNGVSLSEITDAFGLKSVEVEKVDYLVHATDLVCGQVLEKEPHPNSDHLSVLKVDIGSEVLNIVCGAKNVAKGQIVLVAKIGCRLDGSEIGKAKIRGVESCGMVCSLEELGIESKFIDEKYKGGIFYFPQDETPPLGEDGAKALMLDDPVIELNVTANRGDLLCMRGVARECASFFHRPLTFKDPVLKRIYAPQAPKIKVTLASPLCLTYRGQYIRHVVLKPSPRWLKSRLIAFGVRPLNNFVDITNYIMALFNQPLHAFDADKIGNEIIVKEATEGEEFVTLDNKVRVLKATDLTIRTPQGAIALAGVMGGRDSEITDATQNIFLEAAVFDPHTIRKTALRLNLHSEASYRYERGVDLNQTQEALDYACYLYQALCDAEIVNEPSVAGIKYIANKRIPLKVSDVNHLLGTRLKKAKISSILKSLQFDVADDLTVSVPNRRPDIQIKEDLIEEVARLYGYDKIKTTLPKDNNVGGYTLKQKRLNKIKQSLVALGLDSVFTYTLTDDNANRLFALNQDDKDISVKLLAPLSEDKKVLRRGLIPSLLDVCRYNFSRKEKDVHIFEVSKIYSLHEGKVKEEMFLGGALANEVSSCLWQGKKEDADFYYVKGIIEALAAVLGVSFRFAKIMSASDDLHPNRTAAIIFNGEKIGFLGELHPQYAKANDLEGVVVFEMVLDSLLNLPAVTKKYLPIEKLPKIERDIALVIPKETAAQDVVDCIKSVDDPALKKVAVFDLYAGSQLQGGAKSLALKLTFLSLKPLTDADVSQKIDVILNKLKIKLQAELRN